MEAKFITVTVLGLGNLKAIAIDNIASMEPYIINCTRIVLKEIKDGNNVEVLCTESFEMIGTKINSLMR